MEQKDSIRPHSYPLLAIRFHHLGNKEHDVCLQIAIVVHHTPARTVVAKLETTAIAIVTIARVALIPGWVGAYRAPLAFLFVSDELLASEPSRGVTVCLVLVRG